MQHRFEPEPFRRVAVAAPDLTGNEEAYVVEAIRSGWVSSGGEFLTRFEREFAAACGTRHAVAVHVHTVSSVHVFAGRVALWFHILNIATVLTAD